MRLTGSQIAGGNSSGGRVKNDFYATNPEALEMLLRTYDDFGKDILEPCVGRGHLAKVLEKHGAVVTALDIVDRGYPGTIVRDFLVSNTKHRYDSVVTNPPYSLAKEFVEKSLQLVKSGGKVAMFLKIQFLEGQKRKELFENYPPKYIYVFRNRMATWNSGLERDPKTGKKWMTTMCHAWFIWEKDSKSEPIVRWL